MKMRELFCGMAGIMVLLEMAEVSWGISKGPLRSGICGVFRNASANTMNASAQTPQPAKGTSEQM